MKISGVLFFFNLVVFSSAGKFPSNFIICKLNQEMNKCLKIAIEDAMSKMKNGIPELGAIAIEPINIPSATIDEGHRTVNVRQQYTNMKIYNIANSKVEDVESFVSPEEFNTNITLITPEIRFQSEYDFNGRILLLPITGKGECNVTLSNVTIGVKTFASAVEKKGKTYYNVDVFKLDLNPKKVHYKFDNLFNRDERLGRELNNVLNDNWKDVFDDVKSGYEEMLNTVLKAYINTIFNKVEIEHVFPL